MSKIDFDFIINLLTGEIAKAIDRDANTISDLDYHNIKILTEIRDKLKREIKLVD